MGAKYLPYSNLLMCFNFIKTRCPSGDKHGHVKVPVSLIIFTEPIIKAIKLDKLYNGCDLHR